MAIRFLKISHTLETGCVGLSQRMSLQDNRTAALWRAFQSRARSIENRLNDELVSLQLYPDAQWPALDLVFTKWALAETKPGQSPPDGLQAFTIPAGDYAVFEHIGPARLAAESFGYIARVWLPGSGYHLDNRPHFERLPLGYSPLADDAREQIWVPIRAVQP